LEIFSAPLLHAGRDKLPVPSTGFPGYLPKLAQDEIDVLPFAVHNPNEGTVTRPWVPIQVIQSVHRPRPNRIQMNVAHEFQQIRILLDQNRFVTVLKQMPPTSVAPVKPHRITGEEPAHRRRKSWRARAQQNVEMV
jgi:hypothetical protein